MGETTHASTTQQVYPGGDTPRHWYSRRGVQVTAGLLAAGLALSGCELLGGSAEDQKPKNIHVNCNPDPGKSNPMSVDTIYLDTNTQAGDTATITLEGNKPGPWIDRGTVKVLPDGVLLASVKPGGETVAEQQYTMSDIATGPGTLNLKGMLSTIRVMGNGSDSIAVSATCP